MTKNIRRDLKDHFRDGALPTGAHFAELIDNMSLKEEVNDLKEEFNDYQTQGSISVGTSETGWTLGLLSGGGAQLGPNDSGSLAPLKIPSPVQFGAQRGMPLDRNALAEDGARLLQISDLTTLDSDGQWHTALAAPLRDCVVEITAAAAPPWKDDAKQTGRVGRVIGKVTRGRALVQALAIKGEEGANLTQTPHRPMPGWIRAYLVPALLALLTGGAGTAGVLLYGSELAQPLFALPAQETDEQETADAEVPEDMQAPVAAQTAPTDLAQEARALSVEVTELRAQARDLVGQPITIGENAAQFGATLSDRKNLVPELQDWVSSLDDLISAQPPVMEDIDSEVAGIFNLRDQIDQQLEEITAVALTEQDPAAALARETFEYQKDFVSRLLSILTGFAADTSDNETWLRQVKAMDDEVARLGDALRAGYPRLPAPEDVLDIVTDWKQVSIQIEQKEARLATLGDVIPVQAQSGETENGNGNDTGDETGNGNGETGTDEAAALSLVERGLSIINTRTAAVIAATLIALLGSLRAGFAAYSRRSAVISLRWHKGTDGQELQIRGPHYGPAPGKIRLHATVRWG